MIVIQNVFSHADVLVGALVECGAAFFALLGTAMVGLSAFLMSDGSTQKQALGPTLLGMVGAPLAVASGLVLLYVVKVLNKAVRSIPAADMVQLGGQTVCFGLLLLILGWMAGKSLERAFPKNEEVLTLPILVIAAGFFTVLAGLSSVVLSLFS